ncbi:MAG: hypothetical protein ACREBU_15365 [Nitrososphaera sp.]
MFTSKKLSQDELLLVIQMAQSTPEAIKAMCSTALMFRAQWRSRPTLVDKGLVQYHKKMVEVFNESVN